MAAPILPILAKAAPYILAAGSSIWQSARQRKGVEDQNKENRIEAQRQRDWNLSMWHQQNQYNHPQQQMARLKEAGLNPHLIYGTGASSAVGTAGDVKGYDRAEAKNVNEGFDAFSNMYRFNNLQAQTNNIEAQTQVADQDAVLKANQALNIAMDTSKKSFDLGLSKELREHSIQAAIANSQHAVNQAKRSYIDAMVAEQASTPQIEKILTESKIALQTLKGIQLENYIKEKNKNLARLGARDSDNLIFRMLIQAYSNPDNPFHKLLNIFNK